MIQLPLHLPEGHRWALWHELPAAGRGPQPVPEWLVTGNAVDHDLGVLKTGKEADAFLTERYALDGEETCLLVRKQYRPEHLQPRRDTNDLDMGRMSSRDRRALENKSLYGRFVLGETWPSREFRTLVQLWQAGVPVPYPVSQTGPELWMEFVTTPEGDAAPRLFDSPNEALDESAVAVWDAAVAMSAAGVVHGDFSPFNVLAPRPGSIVIIDVPQATDVKSQQGMNLLQRDLTNFATWFRRHGVALDADEWFGQCIASAFTDASQSPCW